MNKKEQKAQKKVPNYQGPQSVAQVFSISRDISSTNPYHTDGDMQMYSQQNIKLRQQLKNNQQINNQLEQLMKLYVVENDRIVENQYKKIQAKLAVVLRPDIQEDQLRFVVDKDWELDAKQFQGKYITKDKLRHSLFQLVDVWTLGNSKQQYVSFCKLLKKKVQRIL